MKKSSKKGGVKNLNKQVSVQKKATPTKRNINKTETAAPRYQKMGGPMKRGY